MVMTFDHNLAVWPARLFWSAIMRLNAPINGMPHLAYLREMLEERGGFHNGCRYLPRGVGTKSGLPIHSNCILVMFKHLWDIPDEFHRYPYLPVTHCAQRADMGYL